MQIRENLGWQTDPPVGKVADFIGYDNGRWLFSEFKLGLGSLSNAYDQLLSAFNRVMSLQDPLNTDLAPDKLSIQDRSAVGSNSEFRIYVSEEAYKALASTPLEKAGNHIDPDGSWWYYTEQEDGSLKKTYAEIGGQKIHVFQGPGDPTGLPLPPFGFPIS